MYITATEYEALTGRPAAEATSARILASSLFLDARIGNYVPDATTGLKLDMDDLAVNEEYAVKLWVAHMISFLYDSGDVAPSHDSVHLGRFSVTVTGQQGKVIPQSMDMVDALLVSSGLIKRGVVSGGYRKLGLRSEYEI